MIPACFEPEPMGRLLRALSAAALLSAAPACGGEEASPRAPSAGRPSVLILSIDTLRADHLGCYGYAPYAAPVSPAIDQFAQEALLFERCFAPRGQTGPSLSSMLTGCYPSTHGVLDNFHALRPGLPLLPRLLAADGYATHAFLSFFPIAKAAKASLGFERGDPGLGSFHEAKPRQPDGPQSAWDDAAEQGFLRFLRGRARGAAPFFAWVHFYDVHGPYRAPLPFGEQFVGDYRGPLRMASGQDEGTFERVVRPHLNERIVARAPLTAEDARYVVALYDGGIRATDERIGRILRALDECGVARDTIVVLTADHGEELGEHNHFWFHGNSVYDSVLRIPLIVRGPGVVPGRRGELIQNVDLLPTLLAFLGAGVPDGIDGISFAAELRGARADARRRAIAWSEWEHLILGARSDRWKLLFNPHGARPKKPPYDDPRDPGYLVDCHELYEVSVDAAEARNVWSGRKGDVAELRALVEAEHARRFAGLLPPVVDAILDPVERERLQRLGYTAGDAADYVLDPSACEDD